MVGGWMQAPKMVDCRELLWLQWKLINLIFCFQNQQDKCTGLMFYSAGTEHCICELSNELPQVILGQHLLGLTSLKARFWACGFVDILISATSGALSFIMSCLAEITNWMYNNFLQLSDTKPQIIILPPPGPSTSSINNHMSSLNNVKKEAWISSTPKVSIIITIK